MQRQYYVYLHRKVSNNEVFYVGKGFGKRCFSKSDRTLLWKNTVKKHGYTIDIYMENLQEWYAFEIEKELIEKYGKFNEGGSLVNFKDGGEGSSGHKHSAETIFKFKEICKLRGEDWKLKVSRKGSFHSEDTKRKIATAGRNRKSTPQSREKQSIFNRDKFVYCFLNSSGEIFEGTRHDFNLKYKINIKPLFKTKAAKTVKGWKLQWTINSTE